MDSLQIGHPGHPSGGPSTLNPERAGGRAARLLFRHEARFILRRRGGCAFSRKSLGLGRRVASRVIVNLGPGALNLFFPNLTERSK